VRDRQAQDRRVEGHLEQRLGPRDRASEGALVTLGAVRRSRPWQWQRDPTRLDVAPREATQNRHERHRLRLDWLAQAREDRRYRPREYDPLAGGLRAQIVARQDLWMNHRAIALQPSQRVTDRTAIAHRVADDPHAAQAESLAERQPERLTRQDRPQRDVLLKRDARVRIAQALRVDTGVYDRAGRVDPARRGRLDHAYHQRFQHRVAHIGRVCTLADWVATMAARVTAYIPSPSYLAFTAPGRDLQGAVA